MLGEIHKALFENSEAQLIDVREPAKYRQCHIPSAHLRPLSNLQLTGIDLSNIRVILDCQKRGIEAWQREGLPVNKNTKTNLLAFDRQVQITIGVARLTGVILSELVKPNFIWLSGSFGAGLLFAGLSGFCALARVMALMPRNK